jgi:hypothetical protein
MGTGEVAMGRMIKRFRWTCGLPSPGLQLRAITALAFVISTGEVLAQRADL